MSREALRQWFDQEFSHRTNELLNNRGDLDWVNPGFRVRWSEVVSKAEELGLPTGNADLVDLRLWFYEQMRRRKGFKQP